MNEWVNEYRLTCYERCMCWPYQNLNLCIKTADQRQTAKEENIWQVPLFISKSNVSILWPPVFIISISVAHLQSKWIHFSLFHICFRVVWMKFMKKNSLQLFTIRVFSMWVRATDLTWLTSLFIHSSQPNKNWKKFKWNAYIWKRLYVYCSLWIKMHTRKNDTKARLRDDACTRYSMQWFLPSF